MTSRILVVEDEARVRGFFATLLSEDVVHTAATGRQALLLLRDVDFQLVVLDISLPDVDGIELIRRIRGEFPHVKIIAVSGFMSRTLRTAATSAGAAATLGKPVTPGELRRTVHGLLGTSGTENRVHVLPLA